MLANVSIENPTTLRRLITSKSIRPFFQPIVDLHSANVFGYELLSRGRPPMEMPAEMFAAATMEGLAWDLEKACRQASLSKLAKLRNEMFDTKFFLNVSPAVFIDQRFADEFSATTLAAMGISSKNIVIEITEEATNICHHQFEKVAASFANSGFSIALDDFGSGPSSISSLIATSPHFLKLDRFVVRDIHLHSYKQQLVRSITSFVSSVEGKIIAEGVEKWDELKVLLRLGVRYMQGFLFQHPQPEPSPLSPAMRGQIVQLSRKFAHTSVELDETASSLVVMAPTIEKNSMNCETLTGLWKKSHAIDHVVVVNNNKPLGLITRQHFFVETSGPFGYSLLQKKPADTIMKRLAMVEQESIRVTSLAKLAMERLPGDIYDPIIIVDNDGNYLGTVTIKQLISRASDLEVKRAMGANPLTNLPGNRSIQKWMYDASQLPEFTIVYADLDHFKEYNDCYGFLKGDEVIRMTSQILEENLETLCPNSNLGHIGGDDFVIICPSRVNEQALDAICLSFDKSKLAFFRQDDIHHGSYKSYDRAGNPIEVALLTLSISVLNSSKLGGNVHPGMFAEIASSLKKKIKIISHEAKKSCWLAEQRQHAINEGEGIIHQIENKESR